MKKIISILLLVLSVSIFASGDHDDHDHGHEKAENINLETKKNDDRDDHDDHHHENEAKSGTNKAIQEVSIENGFKLSHEAQEVLRIKLSSISSTEFTITKSSLVSSKDKKGVYIYRNGFYKLHEAIVNETSKNHYNVKIKDYKFGDQVVTQGIELLRVSDIFSTDKSEYGHSH